MTVPHPIFQHVDNLLDKGMKETVIQQLYALIVSTAKTKDFALAEKLREKLIAVDNMALREIIGSAEIIEEYKSEYIDPDQIKLWAPLLDELLEEEKNALLYAIEEIILPPGKRIIEQGKLNDRLFFIDKGTVNCIFKKDRETHIIYQRHEGETAGESTFFGISVATATFICHTSVKLHYLDRQKALSWEEDYPGLLTKIYAFCKTFGVLDQRTNISEVERRRYERIHLQGKVKAQLLNESGDFFGNSFHGHLIDLSLNGAAFSITSSQTIARMLLGRICQISTNIHRLPEVPPIIKNGVIVAVKSHLRHDFSVHLEFRELLNPSIYDKLYAELVDSKEDT